MSEPRIEGVKLRVPGLELAGLSARSAEYHRTRAAELRKDLAQVKELIERHDAERANNLKNSYSSSGRDPVEDMESRAAEHERNARRHDFMASHFDRDAVYLVNHTDMALWGF